VRGRLRTGLLALALGTVLVACGSGGIVGGSPQSFADVVADAEGDASEAQLAALEDGQISHEEIRQAKEQLFACFAEHGLEYWDEGTNPVDGWYPLYGVTAGREADDCLRRELHYLAVGWDFVNEDVMDPGLMTMIQECLVAQGWEITGTERSFEDLVPLGTEDQARLTAVVDVCSSGDPERFPVMGFGL
jgi:hypothetical protein